MDGAFFRNFGLYGWKNTIRLIEPIEAFAQLFGVALEMNPEPVSW